MSPKKKPCQRESGIPTTHYFSGDMFIGGRNSSHYLQCFIHTRWLTRLINLITSQIRMKSHECSSRFPAFGQKKIQNLIQMARMGKPICLDTLQLANHSHLVATLGPSFSREIGHPGCSFELITICTAPDIFLHHPTGWWFQPI